MAHFLAKKHTHARRIGRRACVKVEVNSRAKTLTIQPGIHVAAEDVLWIELPSVYTVVAEGADTSPQPTGRFMVSAESIDPFHLLTDYF